MQIPSAKPYSDQQAASYLEMNDLASLRLEAQRSPDSAMVKVAQQFEGLFINMMLKSMRQASFGDPLFDSDQSGLYRDMFDNQIALDMSAGRGLGLAQTLMVQLGRYSNQATDQPVNEQAAAPQSLKFVARKASQIRPEANTLRTTGENPASSFTFSEPPDFVRKLWPLAQKAAQQLGVAPPVLLAQAALETNWGRAVIRHADGNSSHNLFNIKADGRWPGDAVTKSTLEYRDGIGKHEKARFRAYDSYQDSFNDYVKFVKSNPRYQSALQQAGDAKKYLHQLQKAGYATDPLYANKIIDIMQRDYFTAASATGALLAAQG